MIEFWVIRITCIPILFTYQKSHCHPPQHLRKMSSCPPNKKSQHFSHQHRHPATIVTRPIITDTGLQKPGVVGKIHFIVQVRDFAQDSQTSSTRAYILDTY